MNIVRVELGERSYNIEIGTGLIDDAGNRLREWGLRGSGIAVSDETVSRIYGERVLSALRGAGLKVSLFTIPAGEEYKNLDQIRKIYDEMLRLKLERDSFVLSLGGGVVGDIAGFAAATYMRGVNFVQIPTSLLAQVDASVGGKVAVNLPQGKNLVGAFYQPRGVVIDPTVLATLARRELIAGFAEVIKHAVIRDGEYFGYIEKNLEGVRHMNPACLEKIIRRSCEIKSEVVAQDETEKGLRMILNFGHTIGHAIEAVTSFETYRHGEAVAIGMVCASEIAVRLNHLSQDDQSRIVNVIKAFGLPTRMSGASPDAIMASLKRDKKVRDGKVFFVLPKRIGEVFVTDEVNEKIVISVIEKFSYQNSKTTD